MLSYILIIATAFSFIVVLFMSCFDWLYAKQIKKVERQLSVSVSPMIKKIIATYIGFELVAALIIFLVLLFQIFTL